MDGTESSGRSPWDGSTPTTAELNEAVETATRKLESIIARFGDEDGERRKPYYFEALIKEALQAQRMSKHLMGLYGEKERTAHA